MELCSGGGDAVCSAYLILLRFSRLYFRIGYWDFLNWNWSYAALSSLVFSEPEPEPCGFEWFGILLNRNRSQTALDCLVFTEPEPEQNGFEWFGFSLNRNRSHAALNGSGSH